jgi:Uma2 family endonuclease
MSTDTDVATTVSLSAPAPGAATSLGEAMLRRRLLDVLLAPVDRPRLSYAEFLAWADEDTLAEWVEGAIVMASPAATYHQQLAGFLGAVLHGFCEYADLGVVLGAPFQMKLATAGREPDLLFVAKAHLERLRETYLEGPADLVVEIVSPESAGRDRGEKFYEYAQGGVPEYWLIDPQRQWAEFYRLQGGHYLPVLSGGVGQAEATVLPGFWLRVEWLWQRPLPGVEDVLLEVGGAAYAQRWIERLRRQGFLA